MGVGMIRKRAVLYFYMISFCIMLFSTFALAESDVVIINSADWEDVYSGIMYANLKQLPFEFIIDETQVTYHPQTLANFQNVLLLESNDNPLVVGYSFDLEEEGLGVTKFAASNNINLDLASDLAKDLNTKHYILIDRAYPSSAVSVAPYAVLTGSYVLLIDEKNSDSIVTFLKQNGVDSLLLYGFIDPLVKEKLVEFEPFEINEGDSFSNNIAVVKEYQKIKPVQQVTFSSGLFFEKQMMKGVQPILFVGETDVPDTLIEYLKASDISVAEVVGNELTKSATKVKRLLAGQGKSFYVFIRFGQGTTLEGADNTKKINSLDLLYLPQGEVNLTISRAVYNRATKQLEITYKNKGGVAVYGKSTVKILVEGVRVKTIGDEGTFFVLPQEEKVVGYTLDLSAHEPLDDLVLTAEVLTRYGSGSKELNRILEEEFVLDVIERSDDSELEAVSLTYSADLYKKLIPKSSSERKVTLKVRNKGSTSLFYKPSITFERRNVEETLAHQSVLMLAAQQDGTAYFMMNFDGVEKKQTLVDISYGSQEELLIKQLKQELVMKPSYLVDIIILTVVILLLLSLILIGRRKVAIVRVDKKGTKKNTGKRAAKKKKKHTKRK